ncbi:hypothetical protein ccbrp13_64630 [Ktedonobacteria bacterium brp13]|nr:hypothetical protein ccbrp13_64630 [Ktedonobacteria bacterium brp13]
MTKIRTAEQLQQVLDDELAWRKKELVVIKSLVTANSSPEIINCHIRSGVALTYAHWEGFIKSAGNAYLDYIMTQQLTYAELTNNFVTIAAKKLLRDAGSSNKVTIYAKVTDFFTSGLTERCSIRMEIETKSNLSSDVLKDIIYTLGLDYTEYETKAKFIDKALLKNRNEIAHGKQLLIDKDEFINTHETVVNLIDLFSNQISNAASRKTYKREYYVN